MSPRSERPGKAEETIPLFVRQVASLDLEEAAGALADLSWLSQHGDVTTVGPRRIVPIDLELPVHDRSSPIRKAAYLELGAPRRTADAIVVDIAWRSATFAPLFPVFAGQLIVERDALVLDGRYAPPFGQVGLLLDRGLLHFVARRSASALVSRLISRFSVDQPQNA